MTNISHLTWGIALVTLTSFFIFHFKGKEIYFSIGEGFAGCQYMLRWMIYIIALVGLVLIISGFKENNKKITSS